MKPPRLALLALLLAPLAHAEYPSWPAYNAGSRGWPTVTFTAGGATHVLRCRYEECNPEKNKGQSYLFILTEVGGTSPVDVTHYNMVPRSKWNPRYYTDGPNEMVPVVEHAQLHTYTATLSNFKLDNSGKELVAFQGTQKFPASTDIYQTQYNSYDQMRVVPPSKMVNDVLKPGAPAAQPGPKPGHPGGSPAAQKPPRALHKVTTAGNWKDAVTPIGSWHAIATSKLPLPLNPAFPLPAFNFYCYHENMSKDKSLLAHLKKEPLIVECVNWSAPKDDSSLDAPGGKHKVRNYFYQFDVAFVDGKLTTLNTPVAVEVKELMSLPDTLKGEKFVKVTLAPTAADPALGSALPLSAKEQTWLDKRQAAEYETARAAAVAKPAAEKAAALADVLKTYRKNIVENIQPKKDVSAAYEAAVKDPKATPESIDKSLSIDAWGASPRTIVELAGEREDIQLSKADWDDLNARAAKEAASDKKPAETKFTEAAAKYVDDRTRVDGREKKTSTTFDEKFYDPIVLHRTAEAARMALGKTPGEVKPPVVVAPKRTVLTKEEIELLTPEEAKKYQEYIISATKKDKDGKDYVDETNEKLLDYAELLRKRMKDEKPPRAKAPEIKPEDMTAKDFANMTLPQQRKFCKDYPVDIAVVAGDKRAGEIDNSTADALQGAKNTKGAPVTKAKPEAADAKWKWPKKDRQDACRKLPSEDVAGTIDPTGAVKPESGLAGSVPTPPGEDVENKKKVKTEWMSIPLAQTAFVGGLTGLLIGTLFGPIGLVAGPLLGAALYYGLAVHAANKAKASGDD